MKQKKTPTTIDIIYLNEEEQLISRRGAYQLREKNLDLLSLKLFVIKDKTGIDAKKQILYTPDGNPIDKKKSSIATSDLAISDNYLCVGVLRKNQEYIRPFFIEEMSRYVAEKKETTDKTLENKDFYTAKFNPLKNQLIINYPVLNGQIFPEESGTDEAWVKILRNTRPNYTEMSRVLMKKLNNYIHNNFINPSQNEKFNAEDVYSYQEKTKCLCLTIKSETENSIDILYPTHTPSHPLDDYIKSREFWISLKRIMMSINPETKVSSYNIQIQSSDGEVIISGKQIKKLYKKSPTGKLTLFAINTVKKQKIAFFDQEIENFLDKEGHFALTDVLLNEKINQINFRYHFSGTKGAIEKELKELKKFNHPSETINAINENITNLSSLNDLKLLITEIDPPLTKMVSDFFSANKKVETLANLLKKLPKLSKKKVISTLKEFKKKAESNLIELMETRKNLEYLACQRLTDEINEILEEKLVDKIQTYLRLQEMEKQPFEATQEAYQKKIDLYQEALQKLNAPMIAIEGLNEEINPPLIKTNLTPSWPENSDNEANHYPQEAQALLEKLKNEVNSHPVVKGYLYDEKYPCERLSILKGEREYTDYMKGFCEKFESEAKNELTMYQAITTSQDGENETNDLSEDGNDFTINFHPGKNHNKLFPL